MNSGKFAKWGLMVGLALALVTTLGAAEASPSSQPVAAPEPQTDNKSVTDQPSAAGTQDAESALSDAPIKPVTEKNTLPVGIHASAQLSEIIRLVNSGVDESVMLAFVRNSPSAFNLGAEEIIYLNDIGVPGAVVTAMLQRDQSIKASGLVSSPVFASSAPPAAAVDAGLAPAQVAPQFDPAAAVPPAEPAADAENPDFYTALAPYGTWVDVEGYGRCWQPTAVVMNSGWRPYFDGGHWVYTDCGWYWLSDYSWGWAPFHYGRWFQHRRLGWCWAPDYVWGPSWVSWRYTDDYCGWAPLPPYACYSPGFGFTWYGQPVGFSFGFGLGWNCFAFVSWNHFHDYHLSHHGLGAHESQSVFGHSQAVTRIVGNRETVINQGIAAERVAAATHRNWSPVTLHGGAGSRPATGRTERFDPSGKSLTVYRPMAAPTPQSSHPPSSPSRVQPRHGATLPTHVSTRIVDTLPSRTDTTTLSRQSWAGAATGSSQASETHAESSGAVIPSGSNRTPPLPVNTPKAQPTRTEPLIIHGSGKSGISQGSVAESISAPSANPTPWAGHGIEGGRQASRQASPGSTSPALTPNRPSDTSLSARTLPWLDTRESRAMVPRSAVPDSAPTRTDTIEMPRPTQRPDFTTPQPLQTSRGTINVPRYNAAPNYTPARPSYTPTPALGPSPARPALSATPATPTRAPAPSSSSVPSVSSNQGLGRGR